MLNTVFVEEFSMSRFARHILVLLVVLIGNLCVSFASESHKSRVENFKVQIKDAMFSLEETATHVDVELKKRRLHTDILKKVEYYKRKIYTSREWQYGLAHTRDTHKLALMKDKISKDVRALRTIVHDQLVLLASIERAEYESWDLNHPQEARVREIKRSMADAQDMAWNAQVRAHNAELTADQALFQAEQAQRKACEAEYRAGRAEREARQHRCLY